MYIYSGSLKYVHQSCLQQWLTASDTRSCELCKFNFIMHTKIKPFNEVNIIIFLSYSTFRFLYTHRRLSFQWRSLEMSGVERRRLCCAVLFHCVAALCVMWSLFVLIDRAAEEIQRGLIGFFIIQYYVCKMYYDFDYNFSFYRLAVLDKISCSCSRFYRRCSFYVYSVPSVFHFVQQMEVS